jgi:CHAT domain-containing protein
MVTDEHILQQKGRVYGHLFDRMAGILAKAKRGDDALALLESFRGIALRVHTRDVAAADAANKAAMGALSESWLGQLLGTGPTHRAVKGLTLEPVLPRIRPLLDHVKSANTALISLSIANGMATALVVTGQRTLDLLQWSVDGTSLSVVEQYFNLETGSAREAQLAELCAQGYRTLLQPMEKLLAQRGITRVGVTANGLIGQLPFEAFSRDRTFFYLPSLAVGSDLASRADTRGDGSLLVVGYGDADLEATLEEVGELRRLFADRITIVDTRQMSKADILTKLQGDYDYIHFTCHGSFDPLVPLDSALHLKRDPASDTDRITARDLLDVRLKRTPVVSLSACSTALVAVDVSNSFAGLTGSFLRSGARCVIGSRWPVYDDAAMLFMTTLYSGLRRNSGEILECFAAAQRARRDASGIEDWAAFSFVGLP